MLDTRVAAACSAAALFIALAGVGASAHARPARRTRPVVVTMTAIDAQGTTRAIGTVRLLERGGGLALHPRLEGLPPGIHGFHVHEKGNCAPGDKDGKPAAGEAAGPHFDPGATRAHKGPGGGGHKGDLPTLKVSRKGRAKGQLKVAGLKLADVAGRSLMIHAGTDNYSDQPAPLGGGGDRIACGVIPGAAEEPR